MALRNCWEIKNCQRQLGGSKVSEFGECVASKQKFGHTCWAIAGTLCGGKVQGSVAQKENNCMACEVYKLYNRTTGTQKDQVKTDYKEEHDRYLNLKR